MLLYVSDLYSFTQQEYESVFSLLSEERRQAIARMRIDNDKKRSLLGEALARKGISALCGIEENGILFARDERGKPYCSNANMFFSISHSKERVICAVGEGPLGADIEKIRFVEPRILRACCKESDFEYILGNMGKLPDSFTPEQAARFFSLWTAKEAYCKYTGVGVSGMKSISLKDISHNCKSITDCGFIASVYSENPNFELKTIDLRRGK